MTIEEAKSIVAKKHGYKSILDGIRERLEPNNRYTVMELVHQVAEVYAAGQVKNCDLAGVGQSLPDAEQCLKIQEQVKQYCYTDQDDNPVISSGGIRTIISRWKQMVG